MGSGEICHNVRTAYFFTAFTPALSEGSPLPGPPDNEHAVQVIPENAPGCHANKLAYHDYTSTLRFKTRPTRLFPAQNGAHNYRA